MAAFLYRLAGSPAVKLPATSPFKDVKKTDKFYKEMYWLYSRGDTKGVIGSTFYPLKTRTRGELSQILYLYYNAKVPANAPKFPDVPSTSRYVNGIRWVASQGIWKAGSDGKFGPAVKVSRQDISVFLYRAEH